MLHIPFANIDEAVLRALERDAIPEGVQLEYKQELKLDSEKQKLEAAKDVSALANTAGGRIVYGIKERTLPDDMKVAGALFPLKDGALLERLSNVLANIIHPRPTVEFRRVDLGADGGFVFVVEVAQSYADLHMVTGYGELRYYKRGPNGVLPMTEPEVRDSYARLLAAREKVDAQERERSERELARRAEANESIVVSPLYAPDGLFDPRRFQRPDDALKTAFANESHDFREELVSGMKVVADGRQCIRPYGAQETDAPIFLALRKNGIIHLSTLGYSVSDDSQDLRIWLCSVHIYQTLLLAKLVYRQVGYYGPARARFCLRLAAPAHFALPLPPRHVRFGAMGPQIPEGPHPTGPVEARLATAEIGPIVKELVDPLFQAVGQTNAPWFDAEGRYIASFPELPDNFVGY